MSKREFVMLAKDYDSKKHGIAGQFLSEKFDGMRATWDGGISRGKLATEIPWANTAKDKKPVVSTGLWSRYGKVIHAPDWWLDYLPKIPLDGELWIRRGMHQEVMSIVKRHVPDARWGNVKYLTIDMPSYHAWFSDGQIRNPHFEKYINQEECLKLVPHANQGMRFESSFYHLRNKMNISFTQQAKSPLLLIYQQQLPFNTPLAHEKVMLQLEKITDIKGEGLIIRNHTSIWFPERSNNLLKVKKLKDSEGRVIGYTTGQGKLLGLMGAAIIEWKDQIFEISGFTDEERRFASDDMEAWAGSHPGSECVSWIVNDNFPIETEITFRYMSLTKDGIPREARYWRKK